MNTRTAPLAIAPLVLALGLFSSAAQAALEGRDLNGSADSFEAYYDTDLNITWLADANVNGRSTWADALTWAANLSFTDGVSVYDNWRLPITSQPDASCGIQGQVSSGYSCTGSEMGHLFYNELGGVAGLSILSSSDPDLAQFNNLQANLYWSGSGFNRRRAWVFNFDGGYQGAGFKFNGYYALAVSPGDVAAVPEAQTYALMLAGLGLIGWRARRRG